jgi:hypothetical protein
VYNELIRVTESSAPTTYDWSLPDTEFAAECGCFELYGPVKECGVPLLHAESQDTSCVAWTTVVERIERAAVEEPEVFEPLAGLTDSQRSDVVTLPTTIVRLRSVRVLKLCRTALSWLPAAIGEMVSLEILDIYRSYRLHYFPYELTRCSLLKDSRISTRALFGNYKCFAPFPDLLDPSNSASLRVLAPKDCSVCGRTISEELGLARWTTRRVGTDFVPLLVVACSSRCVDAISRAAPEARIHSGGAGSAEWGPRR